MNNFKFFPIATIVLAGIAFALQCLTVVFQKNVAILFTYNIDNHEFVVPFLSLILGAITFLVTVITIRMIMKADNLGTAQGAAIIYIVFLIVIFILGKVAYMVECRMLFRSVIQLSSYSVLNAVWSLVCTPMQALSQIMGCITVGIVIAYKKLKTDIYV